MQSSDSNHSSIQPSEVAKLLSASIVLFKNNPKVLKQAIQSFLNSKIAGKIFLLDNSPTRALKEILEQEYQEDLRVVYIFNNKNLGFGKAHNIGLKLSQDQGFKYHLVLNPDVYFEGPELERMVTYLEQNSDIAQLMPKVLYPDASLQYLCKMLPTPWDLFLRRFMPACKYAEDKKHLYELRFTGYKSQMNVPYLSGCFMLLRNSALRELDLKYGIFDERIFMYIEDCDLTRRLHRNHQTVFWPEAIIYHHYAKGSYKNWRLMLYNLHGAFVYFCKYGWFFDPERDDMNQKLLDSLKLTTQDKVSGI